MQRKLNLLGKQILFFDGAMGTSLQARGLGPGELPELWNLTRPEIIQKIHESYLKAGCDILKTNTFGANRYKLRNSGASVEKIVSAAVSLARNAAIPFGGIIALDLGPTGKLLSPLGNLEFEDAVDTYKEMVIAGARAGVDCILIETMSDLYEAKAAVLAAKEASSLPVMVTMTFDQQGKLLTGGDVETAAAVLEGLRVDAIGLNCGLGPAQMLSLVPRLRKASRLPIVVNPNAGLPREEAGRTVYDVAPEKFAEIMAKVVKAGASVLGGCCGTTPEHIRCTVDSCQGFLPPPPPNKLPTTVTSGSKAVQIGGLPVIIGERINPTGKPKFKQALRENDLPYLLREGISQQDHGAHILDVNVGLPEIDEPTVMCKAVQELQAVSNLPLQIDTSDPETMARALRLYNGKALVNSVTAKPSSMKAVFPLIQKYGGVVIGLTITEDGIPETPAGRLKAAETIIDTAKKYGIGKEDIVIDPLTMAVSAGQNASLVTLEALKLIKEKLGVAVSLGVSNVSFGLPQREIVTSAFFLMALQNGLDAAIMNPNSNRMMQCYHAFCALSGQDENCMEYIAFCSQGSDIPTNSLQTQEYSLQAAIERGLQDAASAAAEKASKKRPALEIVNQEIVPALDVTGEKFEKGQVFLPQLLMSAEAAKAAFEVIKKRFPAQKDEKNAMPIVIATVKGDVHDIGKNIVKVLLENYGFQVIDLGKDVAPQTVLEAVQREHAPLAGLSALMTTTVSNMKETIGLLKKKAPYCKIMVGGAVLNQEYADMIGADFYGKDAMASVRYASELWKHLKENT